MYAYHALKDTILLSFICVLVPGDKSALNPSGIRLGTPPLTTRGLKEQDMEKVVSYIHKGKDCVMFVSSTF
jgi:Glycine/serine hydroxymethyltransferase